MDLTMNNSTTATTATVYQDQPQPQSPGEACGSCSQLRRDLEHANIWTTKLIDLAHNQADTIKVMGRLLEVATVGLTASAGEAPVAAPVLGGAPVTDVAARLLSASSARRREETVPLETGCGSTEVQECLRVGAPVTVAAAQRRPTSSARRQDETALRGTGCGSTEVQECLLVGAAGEAATRDDGGGGLPPWYEDISDTLLSPMASTLVPSEDIWRSLICPTLLTPPPPRNVPADTMRTGLGAGRKEGRQCVLCGIYMKGKNIIRHFKNKHHNYFNGQTRGHSRYPEWFYFKTLAPRSWCPEQNRPPKSILRGVANVKLDFMYPANDLSGSGSD